MDNVHWNDMRRKELIRDEVIGLNILTKEYVRHFQNTLEKIRGEQINLWLTKNDQYRLLVLRSWEVKYSIPLKDILQLLIPFWTRFVDARQKNTRKSTSSTRRLGVRISTLVGKKSEQLIQETLKKNPEQKMSRINHRREQLFNDYLIMLERKRNKGFRVISDPSSMYTKDGTPKSLEDFASPEAFVKYYRKYIRKNQLAREDCEALFKQWAYRTNPFRPEYL